MGLEDAFTLDAQEMQPTQPAPQTRGTLDDVAAQLDAQRYRNLMAFLDRAIKEGAEPADVLQRLTAAAFGPTSRQATILAETIAAEQHPGGYEIALAAIRRQKEAIKRQQQKVSKVLSDELAHLDKIEQDATREATAAGSLDRALIDVMSISNAPTIEELTAMYNRRKGSRAAMGLLYGRLKQLLIDNPWAPDIVEYGKAQQLADKILIDLTT